MKASDLFVMCLESEGIRYIFGVPGEENADFMMSPGRVRQDTVRIDTPRSGCGLHGGSLRQAQRKSRRLHNASHQVMDLVAMFEPVTKWAETILHPDTVP